MKFILSLIWNTIEAVVLTYILCAAICVYSNLLDLALIKEYDRYIEEYGDGSEIDEMYELLLALAGDFENVFNCGYENYVTHHIRMKLENIEWHYNYIHKLNK